MADTRDYTPYKCVNCEKMFLAHAEDFCHTLCMKCAAPTPDRETQQEAIDLTWSILGKV